MYRHVLNGLGVEGNRCFYVGDGNSNELVGARRHGMITIWVDNGDCQGFKDNWAPGGEHTVRDLREILPIVDARRNSPPGRQAS
jgi:FMN phosphatase YigB (HAD superfamily)